MEEPPSPPFGSSKKVPFLAAAEPRRTGTCRKENTSVTAGETEVFANPCRRGTSVRVLYEYDLPARLFPRNMKIWPAIFSAERIPGLSEANLSNPHTRLP